MWAPVGRILRGVDWPVAFGWPAGKYGVRLAPEQQASVLMALIAPVAILPGGPG